MKAILLAVLFSGAAAAQCATGITDNTQYVCGTKVFQAPTIVDNNLYVGGYIGVLTNGQALVLAGRRHNGDEGAELTLLGSNQRSSGRMLDIRNASNEGVFTVDVRGNVSLSGYGTGSYAQIVDATGVAGHVMMTTTPGQAVIMAGKFNDPTAPSFMATLADGGMSPDGGYFEFAGRHGDVTMAATFPRNAGMLVDFQNPQSGNGAYTDKKAFIDYAGGFGQAGGKTRAQFEQCPSTLVMVSLNGSAQLSQYRYGQEISALMFAADEERWYACTSTGWVGYAMSAEVNTLNARLTAAGIP